MSNINWIPSSIKASVLTDVINWKTIEKSYEDICKRSRRKMISESGHQSLFNAFVNECCNLANETTNINDIIFNESMYSRYCILQDVISKVPIKISYKGLYEMIGDISYPEFEFWYYRFYYGQRDLDYDRSNDPKPLNFCDLPTDVVKKVVEESDVKSRYNLRSVSRGLKSLVDSSLLRIETIIVVVHFSIISVVVDDVETKFYCQDYFRSARNLVPAGNLTSEACRHLSTIFGNPKLQLGSLGINFVIALPENRLVVILFGSLTHKLHVGSLKLIGFTQKKLLKIVLCVKPKILKKLEIEYRDAESIVFNHLVECEQWKQAEEMIIVNPIACKFTHFFSF